MEEEKKDETVDSTNDTASATETEETSTEESTDTAEESEVDVNKVLETNKRLFERAKKAEAEKKELAEKVRLLSQKKDESSASFDPLVDAVLAVKSLEPDEITELGSEARTLGLDPVKYIKSTAGKAHLSQIRSAKKSKEASPETPGRSPVYKKYTQADLSKMSVAELEKIIPRSE